MDYSERNSQLQQSVLDALARARDHYQGHFSKLLVAQAASMLHYGLTKDDVYRAARADAISELSISKLSRLAQMLEKAGWVEHSVEAISQLRSAMTALSRFAQAPEDFRQALPKAFLCFRKSYLVPTHVNISYVEISVHDTIIRYRETRAGSLGASSQRAVLEGTLLYPDAAGDTFYVLALTQFRTRFAVEDAASERNNLVALSILQRAKNNSFETFYGIHAGTLPDNNVAFKTAPYAARILLIETKQSLADAAQRGLIQNHVASEIKALRGLRTRERALLNKYHARFPLSNAPDSQFGLLVAAPDKHLPVGKRTTRVAKPRRHQLC